MIRMYEAQDQTGETSVGTIVKPIDRHISIYATSSEEAEAALHRDVWNKKLPSGKVYQLCPWVGNPELIRSIAFAADGSSQRVFLDPASGPYGELRRIRLPRGSTSNESRDAESAIEQLSLFPPRATGR